MKENYLYKQVNVMVAITAVTFDYHCIVGHGYRLTQKKKIPSIRLAKRFCKALINENVNVDRMIQERKNMVVKTKVY